MRLPNLTTTHGGTQLQNLNYQDDNVGNVQTITDTERSETTDNQYEDLNRLLSASVSNGPNPYSQGFQYNPIGNLTQRTTNGTTTSFSYNGDGARLKKVVSGWQADNWMKGGAHLIIRFTFIR